MMHVRALPFTAASEGGFRGAHVLARGTALFRSSVRKTKPSGNIERLLEVSRIGGTQKVCSSSRSSRGGPWNRRQPWMAPLLNGCRSSQLH